MNASQPAKPLDPQTLLHPATTEERSSGGTGMEIHWGISNSPFGRLFIARTPRGISHLGFLGHDSSEPLQELKADWPNASTMRDDAMATEISSEIFSDSPNQIRLHVKGSDFQITVWRALIGIPSGSRSTYSQIARQLGKPGAARAVGNAVSKNRIAFLIPCHRIVCQSGEIGGFRWGTAK
jgi:AraC family transcriptional regulator of adaptative response/methylated-DNA-[protein]-cysteine methyltransferase